MCRSDAEAPFGGGPHAQRTQQTRNQTESGQTVNQNRRLKTSAISIHTLVLAASAMTRASGAAKIRAQLQENHQRRLRQRQVAADDELNDTRERELNKVSGGRVDGMGIV